MDECAELKAHARELARQFAACRDEARVRVHLAGLDLRNVWADTSRLLDEIEAKLTEFGDKIQSCSAETRRQAELALLEAFDAKERLQLRLDEIRSQVEHTRVQAAAETSAIITRVGMACKEWSEKLAH
jgi:hypothetical protein